MSMCDCNQGRLPCTCKPIEGATIMSEVKRFYFSVEDLGAVADGKTDCTYALQSAGFYVQASEFDRLTAECKALQERLNVADQSEDDLQFQFHGLELSRRDWFDEAQRLQEKLAERDALLRNSRMYVATCRAADPEHHRGVLVRIEAALSASAEQTAQKYNDTLLPFVALMRKELHANADKGDRPGWLAMSSDTCLLEIIYHFGKLQASVKRGDSDGIAEYGADVANMCMMLLDICGVLAFVEQPEPVSSTSDKYKAELYDEVWQLAKDMGFGNVTDALMKLKKQPAPVAVVLPFTEKVICKLERFQECADDGQNVDIGRHWLDLITQLGLLNRVQRSPALWEMTQQGEDALELSRQSAKSR